MADGNYTIPQLYDLAVSAGWNPKVAPYAAATAWVESSGNPKAASGTGPVGLWQINQRNARALGYTLDDRLDPITNAKMALKLWQQAGGENVPQEQGFRDWWPYDRNNSAKEKNFQAALAEAKKGGANPALVPFGQAGPSIWGAVGDTLDNLNPLNALKGIGALADQFANFAKMAAWFVNPANDIRILIGLFGLMFVGAGVWMLGREVRRG